MLCCCATATPPGSEVITNDTGDIAIQADKPEVKAQPPVIAESPTAEVAVDLELQADTGAARADGEEAKAEKEITGCCGHCVSMDKPPLPKDDKLLDYFKKGGFWGSVTGAFGDKKTMWCHQITADGKFAAKEFGPCNSEEEVWEILGKRCTGRCMHYAGSYAYDSDTKSLKCGPLKEKDHDNTCNAETCLFIKSGLPCPTPKWALK